MDGKQKMIVMSADALVSEDMELLRTLPNFRRYLGKAAEVTKVRSIYPTITYPCHRTMITGVYPDKHGISGNYRFMPGTSPLPWKWDIADAPDWKEDIFTEAHKAGYSTAAVFWPTTGNHPAIDYLIDEFWTQKDYPTNEAAFGAMGSSPEMLRIINKNNHDEPVRPKHPAVDQFMVGCACDIIREYKPDILFIHPADVDAARHHTGAFSKGVEESVRATDEYIGQLCRAAEEAGYGDRLNFVLTSDHGQMNIVRVVNINVIFAENGLIRVNRDGTLKDWDAWSLSGGMSALIYLKDPSDRALRRKVEDLLDRMKEDGLYGFTEYYTTKEADRRFRLSGPYSYVLETDGYTSFGDSFRRPLVSNFDLSDYRTGRATHGYLPAKGPQPVFAAQGPAFRENTVIPEAELVDEAPTIARALGIPLKKTDGRVLKELLKG